MSEIFRARAMLGPKWVSMNDSLVTTAWWYSSVLTFITLSKTIYPKVYKSRLSP